MQSALEPHIHPSYGGFPTQPQVSRCLGLSGLEMGPVRVDLSRHSVHVGQWASHIPMSSSRLPAEPSLVSLRRSRALLPTARRLQAVEGSSTRVVGLCFYKRGQGLPLCHHGSNNSAPRMSGFACYLIPGSRIVALAGLSAAVEGDGSSRIGPSRNYEFWMAVIVDGRC